MYRSNMLIFNLGLRLYLDGCNLYQKIDLHTGGKVF